MWHVIEAHLFDSNEEYWRWTSTLDMWHEKYSLKTFSQRQTRPSLAVLLQLVFIVSPVVLWCKKKFISRREKWQDLSQTWLHNIVSVLYLPSRAVITRCVNISYWLYAERYRRGREGMILLISPVKHCWSFAPKMTHCHFIYFRSLMVIHQISRLASHYALPVFSILHIIQYCKMLERKLGCSQHKQQAIFDMKQTSCSASKVKNDSSHKSALTEHLSLE